MEHGVGVVGLGHGFGQAGDGKETEDGGMDGSQVSLLIYPGACVRAFMRSLSKGELHLFLIGVDAVSQSRDVIGERVVSSGARANPAAGGGNVNEVAGAVSGWHPHVLCK